MGRNETREEQTPPSAAEEVPVGFVFCAKVNILPATDCYALAMSELAFSKLAASRKCLNEITKLLNECPATRYIGDETARRRYRDLQALWDEAYRAFAVANEEFSALVKKLPEIAVSH